MSDEGYAHNIEFINNIGIWLESSYWVDVIEYYFGIYANDENIINKIKKKQLKAAIENIFNNFGNYKEEEGWIFRYFINIEKDNPKKVAQAMIDLYELLK